MEREQIGPPPGTDAVRAAVLGAQEMRFEDEGTDGGHEDPGAHEDGTESPYERVPDDAPLDLRLSLLQRNDLGNAARLIARFGGDLINVRDVGWYGWTGAYWSYEHGSRMAQQCAQKTAMAILDEARALELHLIGALTAMALDGMFGGLSDREMTHAQRLAVAQEKGVPAEIREYAQAFAEMEKRWVAHRKWAVTSGNTGKILAMQTEAAPALMREIDDLDARPHLFAVANGTLVLGVDERAPVLAARPQSTFHFRPHRREDLITRIAACDYDPDATCRDWDKFMAEVQPAPAMRDYLYRWFGYAMTGYQKEQIIQLNWGKGANGKSTCLETLMALFGTYAMLLPFASLLKDDKKRGSEATPDLADLPGRRFVVASETEENVEFSVARIKELTERQRMKVRHLNQNFFEFLPQHHLLLMFNDPPNVRATDDGTWRRLQMTPWTQQFVDAAQAGPGALIKDPELPDRLLGQLPGILNRLIDGFCDWAYSRLDPPPDVLSATEDYRRQNDDVGEYLAAVIEQIPHVVTSGKVMYQAYCIWADLSGLKPRTNASFGKALKKRLTARKSDCIMYEGVQVRVDWWREHGPRDGGML